MSAAHTQLAKRRRTDMGTTVQVLVHGLRGQKSIIDLCETDEQMKSLTVLQLKEKIRHEVPELAEYLCPNPTACQYRERVRLVSMGRGLSENNSLLAGYGIQHMSEIFLVFRLPGGGGRGGGGGQPPQYEGSSQGDGGGLESHRRSMDRIDNFQTSKDASASCCTL